MKPYMLFTDDTVDQKAVHQFFDAMSQDFVVQGALMPDAHCGYSLPIGGVVETKGVVVPAWVGYDQGCVVDVVDHCRVFKLWTMLTVQHSGLDVRSVGHLRMG